MDLRNFDENREGCRYEIRRLAEHAGAKPIVLLTNANTQLDLAESLFSEAATQHARPPRTVRYSSSRPAAQTGSPWTPRRYCCSGSQPAGRSPSDLGGDSC
jgi:hypothetical protein